MKTLFTNFKIIANGEILPQTDLSVAGSKIDSFEQRDGITYDRVIDGRGELYLSAGFVDIHTHGGGGYDFMDSVAKEYNLVAVNHAKYGCTALYPTTVSASEEELKASICAFEEAKSMKGGAKLIGIHLEGPYISKNQKGAMDEKYIRLPDEKEYSELFKLSSNIKRMTVAPELEGAAELGVFMREHDVIPSIGHTDADFKAVADAHEKGGYALMTHLYSCMPLTHRVNAWRVAGAVEAGYYIDTMAVELIADGCHLPPEILKMVYKFKPLDKIVLVTDSMRAAGMGEGVFRFGSRANGYDIVVEDGVAKLMDRTAFAGSVATTDRLVRTMVKKACVPIAHAVKMITENPALAMKIDSEYGFLKEGRAADITVFDSDINVKYTMVDGELVFEG
ncbi:MAG: N-acetylglucosamine-6-phosphate deacetylase [Ruminococcaceae bacterium]|nr:N-acetylglucosamine-6-phosphate deacetylase [Oscillospiraceae bacterium]